MSSSANITMILQRCRTQHSVAKSSPDRLTMANDDAVAIGLWNLVTTVDGYVSTHPIEVMGQDGQTVWIREVSW